MEELLSSFVAYVCAGRDSSHGHEHMEQVAETTGKICDMLPTLSAEARKNALIVAWLHDVCDHKYHDDELELKLAHFLQIICDDAEHASMILKTIEHISYSKENKAILAGTPLDFKTILGDYAIVRDIVSDADKLEALGLIGLTRCVDFTMHASGGGLTRSELKERVQTHAREKLLRLKDEFIRTEPGKIMASRAHIEFEMALEQFMLT